MISLLMCYLSIKGKIDLLQLLVFPNIVNNNKIIKRTMTATTHNPLFFQQLDILSSIVAESIYVINVPANRFCYVSPNNLFLCGYAVEDALTLGFDFYKMIVHPDDLSLWKKKYKAVLQYLKDEEGKRDEIDYFSCTFRLLRKYSFITRPLPQMVYHRLKPVWDDDELRFFVCYVGNSTIKVAGNLRMYNKDGVTCEKHYPNTYRWKHMEIEPLTEREKAILMLAGQRNSVKEIANNLHRGYNTIRNQIKAIFEKLEVNSIQEAVDLACYHRLIYAIKQVLLKPIEAPIKRNRILITDEMLHRIQQYFDDGMSIRQAAKLEGVAESAIRYKIKQGKLRKNN